MTAQHLINQIKPIKKANMSLCQLYKTKVNLCKFQIKWQISGSSSKSFISIGSNASHVHVVSKCGVSKVEVTSSVQAPLGKARKSAMASQSRVTKDEGENVEMI